MGNAATPAITDMAAQGAQIDANFSVSDRIAWAFAPHEQSTPNMTVRLEAGGLFNGSTVTERAAQNTSTITAPSSNPRIDRIVVDRATGDVSVVSGSEAGSPTPPAVPEGKAPVAQVLLAVSTTSITNDMITDERVLNALGLGSIAFQNANNVSITGGTINNLSAPLAVEDGGTGSTSLEGLIEDLELGTMAFQDADNVAITGGSITGITDLAVADGGTGASNAADARTNLGAVNIAGDTMTGDLTVSKNQNGQTLITVSNTDSGGGAIAGFNVFSDAAGLQLRVRSSVGGQMAQFFGHMPGGLIFDQEMTTPGGYFYRLGTTNVDYLTIKTSGVGIKQVNPTSELDVNGTIKATDLELTNDLPIAEGGTGASTASDARTNLGLGTMSTQSANSVSITGGAISGITDLAVADGGTGGGSFTDGGVLIGNGTGALQITSAGTAGQVLTSNGAGNDPTFQSPSSSSPVGSGALWFTETPPTGWLICDGSAISRSTYSVLFGVIGTVFGSGDGSSTFNLPNFSNRFPLGVGSNALAATGGAFSRAASDVPLRSHTHSYSGATSSNGAHTHTVNGTVTANGALGENPDSFLASSVNTSSAGAHTHDYSGTTDSASNGSSLDITNPFLAVNFIIKT